MVIAASKHRCLPCRRTQERIKKRAQRAKANEAQLQLRRARDNAVGQTDLKRCTDALKKVRKRTPKNIPKWVTIDTLLPIYRYAARLDQEEPGYWHIVSHKVPLRLDKDVCGLHTIDNLIIKRSRKLNAKAHTRTNE